MSLMDLADLTAHLPPGCSLWRATGGPMAWSDEVAAMYGLQHGVAVLAWQNANGKKSTYPKPPEPPPLAHEVEARRKRDLARAENHLARRRARTRAREVTTTDT